MYSYPHKTAYRKLENIHFSDYKNVLLETGGSLYVHVPFCKSKCGYCNLFSVTGKNENYMADYISACELQLKQYEVPISCFDSLTVGGGDPLILSAKLLRKLLSLAGGDLKLNIETSPGAAIAEKLSLLKESNANRISIGVQSFFDSELASLKRTHNSDSAKKALSLIKSYNFPIINIDLIYGIPEQTPQAFKASLNEAINFEPDEIFIYPLYIRNKTGLSGNVRSKDTYAMYQFARDYLQANGYFQMSMRRFVKNVPASTSSCGFENMLAIGCGGRSYLDNLHFCNPFAVEESECVKEIDAFIKKLDKTEINHGYILNNDEIKRRYVIKNILHYTGVSKREYQHFFGNDFLNDFPQVSELLHNNYIEDYDNCIKLTPLGISLSDYIGPMFISETVKKKMTDWKNT
jgi:oxygen-independent coproporphyrinogen-3 oxidase